MAGRKKIKATFFTVGELAKNSPKIIKKISHAGHFIAHHTKNHKPLTHIDCDTFLHETKDSKNYMEDLIGCKIIGFRAPFFSLTEETNWVPEILTELGFIYSSSTIPIKIKKVLASRACLLILFSGPADY